jgi:parallel beta-helix repeat protein
MTVKREVKKGLVLILVFVLVAAGFVMLLPMNVGAEEVSAPYSAGETPTEEYLGAYEPADLGESGTVYIKSDGTIDPTTAPISKVGDIYTLTGNIYDNVEIQKSGITLDGDGYTVDGTGSGFAIYGTGLTDVTIMDLIVKEFYVGIRLDYSSDSMITGNSVSAITRGGIVIWGSPSTGNTISKNTVTNCGFGIILYDGPSNNYILGNEVTAINSNCIDLEYSANNNLVKDNIVSDGYHGIYSLYSENNVFTNNVLTKTSFQLWGDLVQHWNTHSIDTSNTVNNKPVIYWKNKISGIVPSGAGQVILANCAKIIVKGQNLVDCSNGIALGFSSDCKVYKNSIECKAYGIILEGSTGNNHVYQNTVTGPGSGWGLYLLRSNENKVCQNTISNKNPGIRTWTAYDNTICHNTLNNNYYGIYLIYDGDNTISHNVISGSRYSIRVYSSDGNEISWNSISDAGFYGIGLSSSHSTIIKGNTLTNDFLGIALWGSNDCDITLNKASKNLAAGIYVDHSNNANVKLNMLKENDIGIYPYVASGSVICGNTVMDSNRAGIVVEECSNAIVKGNLVMDNGGHGVYVVGTDGFEVNCNVVKKNGKNGINVENSDNGEVMSNVVMCNIDYDLGWDENGDVTWEWNLYKTQSW